MEGRRECDRGRREGGREGGRAGWLAYLRQSCLMLWTMRILNSSAMSFMYVEI